MEPVDNNQFEIVPNPKSKRKIISPCRTAYMNPALDLLANEDPMVNTAMEVVPKKRKRARSLDIAAFENTALDLGISRAAVNEFLARELENVRKTVTNVPDVVEACPDPTLQDSGVTDDGVLDEPIYANINPDLTNTVQIDDKPKVISIDIAEDPPEMVESSRIMEVVKAPKPSEFFDTNISNITKIDNNLTNNIYTNNQNNLSLSFIDRLAINSPNISNQSLYLDDDLNESNIMEIKTITIITKTKRFPQKKSTNPFLTNSPAEVQMTVENPFLEPSLEYEPGQSIQACQTQINHNANFAPRRLFNETSQEPNYSEAVEYENVDRPESPIYENINDSPLADINLNKQSKILGYDVSQFSAIDIMNLNKNSKANSSAESNDSKKEKNNFLRVGNRLSKRVFKTLKKTFKSDKSEVTNVTLNPYEVPRKTAKVTEKSEKKESGIENPCLNLDNSDEIEIEEIDDEHQYETIKTLRNTKLNMNVTPLKERNNDCVDVSKTSTPGKKVRFDSTLNREKVITGNSFDCSVMSPGFDAKIDKYQDELENCINEKKIIRQNM